MNEDEKLHQCSICCHNHSGVCSIGKKLFPNRDCLVSIGASIPTARCILGKWDDIQMAHSIVWVYRHKPRSGLRYSITLAAKNVPHKNLVLCGDRSAWFSGDYIPSPKIGDKWKDSLVKLQRIIDSPLVTETFLWMYDDTFILQPTPIEYIAIPKHGDPPQGGCDQWKAAYKRTQLLLLEKGLPTHNYSTHYPVVYEKAFLQDVLDRFEAPYLIETLYLNAINRPSLPIDDTFQFSRNCNHWSLLPETTVLNVKQFTPLVEKTIKAHVHLLHQQH